MRQPFFIPSNLHHLHALKNDAPPRLGLNWSGSLLLLLGVILVIWYLIIRQRGKDADAGVHSMDETHVEGTHEMPTAEPTAPSEVVERTMIAEAAPTSPPMAVAEMVATPLTPPVAVIAPEAMETVAAPAVSETASVATPTEGMPETPEAAPIVPTVVVTAPISAPVEAMPEAIETTVTVPTVVDAAPEVSEGTPNVPAPVMAVPETPEATPVVPPAVAEKLAAPEADVTTPVQIDDLEVIEGIGPKIAGLLKAAGISTFAQLAETDINRLDDILVAAKLRRIADPGTWAEQARLAAEGKWAELNQLTETLKGGRRNNK